VRDLITASGLVAGISGQVDPALAAAISSARRWRFVGKGALDG
jgi:hypothetical protein